MLYDDLLQMVNQCRKYFTINNIMIFQLLIIRLALSSEQILIVYFESHFVIHVDEPRVLRNLFKL